MSFQDDQKLKCVEIEYSVLNLTAVPCALKFIYKLSPSVIAIKPRVIRVVEKRKAIKANINKKQRAYTSFICPKQKASVARIRRFKNVCLLMNNVRAKMKNIIDNK